jgi:chemotaxis protein MotA
MNWSFFLGIIFAGGAVFLAAKDSGRSLFNSHGLVIVLGGTAVSTLIGAPLRQIFGTLGSIFSLIGNGNLPSNDAVVSLMSRMARKAQSQGGLLALQNDSAGVAGGFVGRAISVAIATGESNETRRLLEAEIRQLRIKRQEEANILRTMGSLSPMFGLLGTLLGMIRVLEQLSTPTKIGPAMALALSSAFSGIAFANLVCVPISGQMRLRSMVETLTLEMIMEGVLDIAAGKPPSIVELHLQGYAQQARGGAASRRAAEEPT